MSRLTLTFDNGPEPEVTHDVLDKLARRDIKATFFCVGRQLESAEGQAAAARAADDGHWLGSHSYTHSVSLGDSDDPNLFDLEVTRAHEALGELAHPDRLFRPFCNAGHIDQRVFKHEHVGRMEDGGYTCVLFDPVVNDWEDADGWVDRALGLVEQRAWTTLVIHDIVGYPPGNIVHGMRNLDSFLDQLDERGHEIVQEIDPRPEICPLVRGELRSDVGYLCN